MPATCSPAPHGANAWRGRNASAQSAEEILKGSSSTESAALKTLLASSFSHLGPNSTVFASSNGFVNGVVNAYSNHYHLIIRPEDVWFSILTQLSLYINANAELLRDKFVAHEGQKELIVFMMGTLKSVDYATFFFQMGKEIEKNVVDPELRKWVLPAFTTTTKVDEAIASAIFMGTMQKYFTYRCCLRCGIPSVTLLGQRSDWETILIRLDKLLSFGPEPTVWLGLLKPVMQGFLATFDAPTSESTKDFWQKVAHNSGGGSGPTYLSGWITAFCFWGGEGNMLYRAGTNVPLDKDVMSARTKNTAVLELEGTRYHRVETGEVPPGFTTLPLKIEDVDGTIYDAHMLAGSVGMTLTSTGQQLPPQIPTYSRQPANPYHFKDGSGLDTIQPESGWIVYTTKSEDEMKEYQAGRSGYRSFRRS